MKKLLLALIFFSVPVFAQDLVITADKSNGQIVIHEATNAWSAGPFNSAAELRQWVLSKDPFDSDFDVIMKAAIKAIAQSDPAIAQTYKNKTYTYTPPSDPTVVAAP